MNCFGLEPCRDVSFVTDISHREKTAAEVHKVSLVVDMNLEVMD